MSEKPYIDRWWAPILFIFLFPVWLIFTVGDAYLAMLDKAWKRDSKEGMVK